MPGEGARGGGVEERARLLEVERGVDAQVLLQLRHDLGAHLGRIREVAADRVAERELGVERGDSLFGHTLGQEALGLIEVEVPGGVALTPERHVARGEVGRDLGSLRVEVVDDLLAVDAHGNRLADLLVAPRLQLVVEADVERVEGLAHVELERAVRLDVRDVVGTRVVHAVDVARLQLEEPLGCLIAPVELETRRERLGAPVAVEGLEDHPVALAPLGQLVRAGAVGLIEDATCRPRGPRGSRCPGCRTPGTRPSAGRPGPARTGRTARSGDRRP